MCFGTLQVGVKKKQQKISSTNRNSVSQMIQNIKRGGNGQLPEPHKIHGIFTYNGY